MKNYIFKIIIIILIFVFNIYLFSLPEKNDIENIIKKEIKNEISKNKINQFISDFFISVFQKTSNFIFYSFIIFSVVIIALIIILIIARNVSSSKYISQFTEAIKEEHKENVFNEEYFQGLIKNNDFSKAIVYLHRCTIFYLLKNKIIYSKNMTNNSLFIKIKINSIKDAFKKIYIFSERILFDNYIADNNDLSICKDLYYNNFLTDKI